MKYFIGVLFTAALLSPILILISSGLTPTGSSAIGEVLAFTIAQAFLSALLALVLGVLGAYGLEAAAVWFGPANGKFLEALSLLPNVAPVLLFLLAVMKYLPGARGLPGIVLVHALLNTGLVSVTVLRLFRSKVAGLADLARVEGASRFVFLSRVVLPVLRADLRVVFIFVFAICFSSLSVPLMIGGSRATTLEVLIWQTLRIDGDFSRAFAIALVQLASILTLTLFLRSRTQSSLNAVRAATPLLSNFAGLPVVLFPTVLLLLSLVTGLWNGISMFFEASLAADVIRCFFGSAIVALTTGVLVIAGLLTLAYLDPRGWMRRLFLGYVAPSSVITGFALLLIWRTLGFATYIKIALALTLVCLPSFYRLYWDAFLSSLRAQRTIAQTLGASESLTFRRVVLPQLIKPACFVAGLSALWAWGDFALSRTIAEHDLTLGMLIQSLMSAYRFEIATVLIWILLFGGAATFFIFEGAGRVLGQKSSS